MIFILCCILLNCACKAVRTLLHKFAVYLLLQIWKLLILQISDKLFMKSVRGIKPARFSGQCTLNPTLLSLTTNVGKQPQVRNVRSRLCKEASGKIELLVPCMAAIVAGWTAEVTITKLLQTAYNFFVKQSDRLDWINQRSTAEGLGRLQTRYEQVHEVLARIENGPVSMDEMDPGLRSWLWQFRDAVEAADNLLDDFEHRRLQEQVHAEEGIKVPSIDKPTSKFIKIVRSSLGSDPLMEKLAQVVKQLDGVVANTGDFLTLVYNLELRIVRDERRLKMDRDCETGSLQTESKIFGREKEIEDIRNWLLDTDFEFTSDLGARSNFISVMTMVGIGGIGKTTILQEIYNDTKVKGFFSITMWVCVSSTFSVPKILYKMVEDECKGNTIFKENLDLLQEAVRKKITSQRFLLVLDDVWDDENHKAWNNLIAPLRYGKSGSKILIATRVGSVATMVQNVTGASIHKYYNLRSLEYEDFLPLLNKYAFTDVNINGYRDLQLVGQQIAKKLGGIPLLGKIVGGQLNSCLDYDYWVRVLDNDVMNLQQGERKFFEVLKLSYQILPTKLHACFRYCSIFPEDYDFEKDDLIQMWMAAGLIPESQVGRSRPEDVGEEYFSQLVAKSFINETQWETYAIHDSLHNLACNLSKDECWRVQGNDSKNVPQTIRHLSARIDDISILKTMVRPRYLRTLVLEFNKSVPELAIVLDNLLRGLSSLRLVKLCGPSIDGFPEAIGDLLHLRYISFDTNCDISIPNCFNKLHHLKAIHLYLRACRSALDLKVRSRNLANNAFSKLTRLRYFSLFGDNIACSVALFAGFGKLTSLQKLEKFDVRDEDGYKLNELKELDNLHHSLEIAGIENVRNYTEATEAFLKNKRFLNSLSFIWNSNNSDLEETTGSGSIGLEEAAEPEELYLVEKDGSDDLSFEENVDRGDFYLDEKTSLGDLELQEETEHTELEQKEDFKKDGEILNCLKPNAQLKELSIKGYIGKTPPIWLINESLGDLISVTLWGCHRITVLPPLGKLPFLKSLHLMDLPGIAEIGCEIYGEGPAIFFPVLEEFKMSDMPKLKEWYDRNQADDLFPKLRSLCLSSCPLLEQIPSLPLGIKEIDFNDVGLSSLPCFRTNQKEENSSCALSSSLSSLIVWNCPNLVSLADGFLQTQKYMVSLSKVEIRGCARLISLPNGGFTGLMSLKDLFIEFPPSASTTFSSEETFPISIESLCIVDHVDIFLPKLLYLTNLSFLELERSEVAFLPMEEEFRKLTKLSSLAIYQFRKIKSLGGVYSLSYLNDLRIHGCYKLEMIDFEMGGKGLSKLLFLEIQDCKELLFLQNFYVISSLKDLNVERCPKLSSLNFKQKSFIGENGRPNTQQSMTLHGFNIKDCRELESLGLLYYVASVDRASIFRCEKLANEALIQSSRDFATADSIPRNSFLLVDTLSVDNPSYLLLEPIRELTSIKELMIQDCSRLCALSESFLLQNRGSIRELYLQELGDLESLPEVLEELCSLTTLDVQEAMELKSLPRMPASLKTLRIEFCNPELQKKCQRRIGELWPNIAHIPSINIIP
ncbi:Disease resistance protein RGA2 [Rhynchospora pubera]|uniref:Disease resistance protein RGA2 n=1 Tax=Rhynchospora pubera TaxID=906938 RepID=A0AAV8FJ95_9POAL|nr:Disease resistance protein RGA2 [Rhynchospora pubera]